MYLRGVFIIYLSVVATLVAVCSGVGNPADYLYEQSINTPSKVDLNYRLFKPNIASFPSTYTFPIVIFLHGTTPVYPILHFYSFIFNAGTGEQECCAQPGNPNTCNAKQVTDNNGQFTFEANQASFPCYFALPNVFFSFSCSCHLLTLFLFFVFCFLFFVFCFVYLRLIVPYRLDVCNFLTVHVTYKSWQMTLLPKTPE
jgi:hypothetical protein